MDELYWLQLESDTRNIWCAEHRYPGYRFYKQFPSPYKFEHFVAISPVHSLAIRVSQDGCVWYRCERDHQWSGPVYETTIGYLRAEVPSEVLQRSEELLSFIMEMETSKPGGCYSQEDLERLSEIIIVLPSYPGEFRW